jgi:hypothetical protein
MLPAQFSGKKLCRRFFGKAQSASGFSGKRDPTDFFWQDRIAGEIFWQGKTCQCDFPRMSPRRSARRFEHWRFRPCGSLAVSSFLLAHCGGGQDKPGFLGPSAEYPGSNFFPPSFVLGFCRVLFTFLLSIFSLLFFSPSFSRISPRLSAFPRKARREGQGYLFGGPVPRGRRFPQAFGRPLRVQKRAPLCTKNARLCAGDAKTGDHFVSRPEGTQPTFCRRDRKVRTTEIWR